MVKGWTVRATRHVLHDYVRTGGDTRKREKAGDGGGRERTRGKLKKCEIRKKIRRQIRERHRA